MSDHTKELHYHHELPGLQESAAGDRKAEAASEAARAAAADKRARGHDAAAAGLSGLGDAAAGYLALRLQEATHGAHAAYLRVMHTLQELGVRIPPGFLP